MGAFEFIAEASDENERIDRFLAARQNDYARSGLEKLFTAGKITVNEKSASKNHKLKSGDLVRIETPEIPEKSSVKPQSLPLEIVYEDAHLLVVNKPQGMVVHPSSFDEADTLVNALLYHCGGALSAVGGGLRPGIVHRIDKDTSGLLVVAKTDEAHEKLAAQAEAHTMLRRYEGIVHGRLKENAGTIDAPVGRHPVHRTKRAVLENARNAVTRYRVIAHYNKFTHVEFELETGRTHQIRVHMAHIGHPVAGDAVYGHCAPVKPLKGQCLHARTLGFTHPATGMRLEFSAELPQYFVDFLIETEESV